MRLKFLLTAFLTALVLFILNAIVYLAFLKEFFQNHPAVSESFTKQLYKPDDQIIVWATIVSALAIGLFVTVAMHWSGARTFFSGLQKGFIFGLLLLCSVDFGLLASTNNFTTAGALADLSCSTITITIAAAFCAWMLGAGNKKHRQQRTAEKAVIDVA